ncbi:metallophosphoesterase [Bifidobacterium sp. 82T10]|uniref:Metallophosphoesterase n=1 Tax=Bifidobacterium miconis TaxID=2834435 RepID=A0ABS6WH75_9BIFI|nr:metallophosphoesterase [Bifidobacterium miconis]MBW3093222.1 metallophosphoesterase [Bifidobacterium miconis]
MTELNQNDERPRGAGRPVSVSARLGRLQFHNSGKFRVLQLADIQDGPKVNKDTIKLIEAAVDAARPDLVIFTGNQIAGYDPAFADTFRKRHWTPAKPGNLDHTRDLVRGMIATFVEPLAKRGVPFAVTYGNHDFQCGLDTHELDAIYREFPGCLNPPPETAAASEPSELSEPSGRPGAADAPGDTAEPHPRTVPQSGLPDQLVYPCETGTFALPVMDADRTRTVLGIVVANSGDYSAEGGYGKPSARTLGFLRSLPSRIGVKSLVFQHMPLPQYYDLLKPVEANAAGAMQGYRAWESRYYVLDETKTQPGSYLGEGISCPDYDSGEFVMLVDSGGYFGVAAGHDHRNGFVGTVDGLMLVATPTCGFDSYGPAAEKRAARLFEFDIRHPYRPRTQLLEYGELVGKPSSGKAYSYDIASVKSDREGMDLLKKKTLWDTLRGLFA